jgi:hypothetical protein
LFFFFFLKKNTLSFLLEWFVGAQIKKRKLTCNLFFFITFSNPSFGHRSIHASSSVFSFYYHVLMFLSRLNMISIDFFYDGLATQHLAVNLFVRHLAIGARNTITSLSLTRLARVDFPLCSLISSTFPYLIELRLSCTERLDPGCCWECLEESASTMVHSPIPDVCTDIRVLAVSELH